MWWNKETEKTINYTNREYYEHSYVNPSKIISYFFHFNDNDTVDIRVYLEGGSVISSNCSIVKFHDEINSYINTSAQWIFERYNKIVKEKYDEWLAKQVSNYKP